jgi:hypothetical protein
MMNNIMEANNRHKKKVLRFLQNIWLCFMYLP